jgi:hypothetical protein
MWRELTEPELCLMTTMLSDAAGKEATLRQLTSSRVMEMRDGGMGSLRFEGTGGEDRRLGKTISQAEFVDEDGVPVSVTINLDQDGNLYELDVWKVDFSPLKRWPKSQDIVVKE